MDRKPVYLVKVCAVNIASFYIGELHTHAIHTDLAT